MNWRPHTECPENTLSAVLIASRNDGFPYIHGLYTWSGNAFRDEETGRKINIDDFWWVLESEIMESLPE